MRVLMISKACLIGSYQTKLEEIGRHPDIELTVVVPPSWRQGGHNAVLERAHTSGYEMIVEPIAFNGSFHLHFYPGLGRRMRAIGPDIVHIDEEPYNLATFHALRLGNGNGATTLWFSWQNLQRRYPLPFRLIERYNLRNTDYAIVGSTGASAVWRAKGYAGPLAVIPQFGVSTEDFVPRDFRREPDRGFVIGYVGRLVPEKGVDLLLQAVAHLGGEWRLVIAGAGPQRSHLVTLSRSLGIADRVTFDGHVSSVHMPAYYRELDALVLPSLSRPNWVEQFGRVLIEAMAVGVPVVGSDCGEIPQVIGEAGLVFPEGDVASLGDCLVRLMRDPELWSHLARRGRERVLTQFTQAEIARRTVAVYRELAGHAP